MSAFKSGKRDILIATDVAARGIDVDDVTHVINHTVPDDEKTYLHRVGRTGRAGRTGIAVTFVDWEDLHKWTLINSALSFDVPEPRETYSSSPHLFEELNIPEGTKGRLKATPVKDATAGRGSRGGSRGSRRGGAGGERSSTATSRSGAGSTERSSEEGAPRRRRRRRRTRGGGGGTGAGESSPAPSQD